MAKIFGTPTPEARYWRRPGAYAIIPRDDGHIAVVEMYGKYLHLPGGGLDPGETPEQALIREVQEETGLQVRPLRFLREVEEYARSGSLGHFIKAGRYYEAELIAVIGPPEEEGHRLLWMPPQQAARSLVHAGQRWLLDAVWLPA